MFIARFLASFCTRQRLSASVQRLAHRLVRHRLDFHLFQQNELLGQQVTLRGYLMRV